MKIAFEIGDIEGCVTHFKAAFQNMDKQRAEIREDWKTLFEFDHFNQPGTDIDLKLIRCADQVDFDVLEP